MLTNIARMLMLYTEEDLNLKVPMASKENCRVIVTAEVMVELKVMVKEKVHVKTVEPVTHLNDVLPMERSVTMVV